eukprot:scaffold7735_cov135-Isochrysis_galbana.AAC.1
MAAREEALRLQAERLVGWTDGDRAGREEAMAVAAREQVRRGYTDIYGSRRGGASRRYTYI